MTDPCFFTGDCGIGYYGVIGFMVAMIGISLFGLGSYFVYRFTNRITNKTSTLKDRMEE